MCRRLPFALPLALALVLVAASLPVPAKAQAQYGQGWGSSGWSVLRKNFDLFRNSAKQTFTNVVDSVVSTTKKVADSVVSTTKKVAEKIVRFAVVQSTDQEICYRILGCFSLTSPWISLMRPLPLPRTPDVINVRYYLYTRNQPKRFTLAAMPNFSLRGSDFVPSKKTYFIVHGFLNSGNETWMADLKDAILSKVDGNVFIIDWGIGANEPNYLQAASNTRVVGREIAYFGRTLVSDFNVSASNFHFLGHSLGAHISGYAARNITGVGRVTGFDPAGPGFELLPKVVRLTKKCADFVDIIHSNAKPVTMLGFGMMHPIGHQDFYMNGGVDQPGCATPDVEPPKTLLGLISIPVATLSKAIGCSHCRAHTYFTEAINNTGCRMWGHQVSVAQNRRLWSRLIASHVPLVTGKCEDGKCAPLGLDSPKYPARGALSVVTGSSSPFCLPQHSNDGQSLEELRSLGLLD